MLTNNLKTHNPNDELGIWAQDFQGRYGDVLINWEKHGDPLKQGLAAVVAELAGGTRP